MLLIHHLHVCEIPLHTACSFTVVMSILSSRPKFPLWQFCLPNAGCAFQTFSNYLLVRVPNLVPPHMNILPSEDSPSLACGSDAAFSFASNCSLSSESSVCTSAARFLDGRLSVSMARPSACTGGRSTTCGGDVLFHCHILFTHSPEFLWWANPFL